MKPICANCSLFYRPHKNGVYFTEGMPDGRGGWKPYKIWVGDLWKCQQCGSQIIVGTGASEIRVQHESDFEELRQRLRADEIQINDC